MFIWFIERDDGKIFPMDERHAYEAIYGQNHKSRFRIAGTAEAVMWAFTGVQLDASLVGKRYAELMDARRGELPVRRSVSELRALQNRYIASIDKLLFEDMVDDKDERVVRGNKKIAELQEEIDGANTSYDAAFAKLSNECFQIQLEESKKTIRQPSAFAANVYNPANNPKVEKAIKL